MQKATIINFEAAKGKYLEEKTGRHNGYRIETPGKNNRLTRLMQIRQQIRTYLMKADKNRNLKNRMESSRLSRTKEKHNLLQKFQTLLSTFKRRGKTGW